MNDRWVKLGDFRANRRSESESAVSELKHILYPDTPVCVHGWVIDEECPACSRENALRPFSAEDAARLARLREASAATDEFFERFPHLLVPDDEGSTL